MGKSIKKEIIITEASMFLMGLSIALFYIQLIANIRGLSKPMDTYQSIVTIIYVLISTLIIYGNIIYHLTRIGLYIRLKVHKQKTKEDFNKYFLMEQSPMVTYLIPAYKEEIDVISQTLWSAGLQYYPNKRIVLLIDNPPNPQSENDIKLLEDTRNLVVKINNAFGDIHSIANSYYKDFLSDKEKMKVDIDNEFEKIDKVFLMITTLFKDNFDSRSVVNHVDEFYRNEICLRWLDQVKSDFDSYHFSKNTANDKIKFILDNYRKIIGILSVEVTSFERKKYHNLSHEPNKAMNINSYLHLIGKRIRIFDKNDESYIEVTDDPSVKSMIPDSDYVITLDADSMLLYDYTIKLVDEMEKEENKKVAVIQTPYSAYPGAAKPVELIAGATTDIQYNIHQGFTYYNSTYWVGANAMLRKSALEDIKMFEIQNNKVAVKYVQDRTVIEDTESSIDLVHKGWRLLNYPERLAYSSTPPDFGSLIIQRERWANGGLIIFPKLIRYVLAKPTDRKRWIEFLVRSNYLVSIAGINIGTLILLVYPFKDNVYTLWLPLASIPYYYLYTRDLILLGYRFSDIVRVYAMNLILIPINIAGVIKSIEQGISGKKIPFKRTPKIGDRVTAEKKFIIFLYALLLYTGWAIIWDIYNDHWSHVIYSGLNGLALFYAIKTFIGFKESWVDLRAKSK